MSEQMKWKRRNGELVDVVGIVEIINDQPGVAVVEWYVKDKRRIEKNHLGASAFGPAALPEGTRHGSLIECDIRLLSNT